MITGSLLSTSRIELRPLSVDDVGPHYVNWMNNPETIKFLESRFTLQTEESVTAFVTEMINSTNNYLFGIFLKSDNRHIGNIRLGPIDTHHGTAAIGLMIGDASVRGQGIGTEAISLITEFSLYQLSLHKVWAGYYSGNVASQNAFAKAGFFIDATLRDHCSCDGKRQDVVLVARLRSSD